MYVAQQTSFEIMEIVWDLKIWEFYQEIWATWIGTQLRILLTLSSLWQEISEKYI